MSAHEPAAPIEFSGTYTFRDILDGSLADHPRQLRNIVFAFVCAVSVAVAATAYKEELAPQADPADSQYPFIMLFAVLMALMGMFPLLNVFRNYRNYRADHLLSRETRCRLDDDGLMYDQVLFPWDKYEVWHDRSRHLAIELKRTRTSHLLPKAWFGERLDAARALLTAKLGPAKGPIRRK